jgi:hypothetical protein
MEDGGWRMEDGGWSDPLSSILHPRRSTVDVFHNLHELSTSLWTRLDICRIGILGYSSA